MNSFRDNEGGENSTPQPSSRRSSRIQKLQGASRDVDDTEERSKLKGPRSMAKSKKKLTKFAEANQEANAESFYAPDASGSTSTDKSTVVKTRHSEEADLIEFPKSSKECEQVEKEKALNIPTIKITSISISAVATSSSFKEPSVDEIESSVNSDPSDSGKDQTTLETTVIEASQIEVNDEETLGASVKSVTEPLEAKVEKKPEEASSETLSMVLSTAEKPQADEFLIDESIILVSDSPEPQSQPKDSTFSPIVDTSIRDARPNIDALMSVKAASLRTSTPLAPRLMKFGSSNTPKPSASRSGLRNIELTAKKVSEEDVFVEHDVRSKHVSVLEKSILKSSRRKRSMSVTDGESFMQKRVMFNSPKFMEIGAIDEKMMASFIEEKENTVMMQAACSGRRKRSLSTGTPIKGKVQSRVKVPNFRAIHELQFDKMESIADHALRKAERAKKLATPNGDDKKADRPKLQQLSKIPMMNSRKVISGASSTTNLAQKSSRILKRSLSATGDEPPRKKMQATAAPIQPVVVLPSVSSTASGTPAKKIAVVRGLRRSNSEGVKNCVPWNAPSTATNLFSMGTKKTPTKPSSSAATSSRAKIEERREKNISLYKTNQTQRSTADHRSKNANILKGVRLNRRFELQMQHRRNTDDV